MKFRDDKFAQSEPIQKILSAAADHITLSIRERGFPFSGAAESPIEEIFGIAINTYYAFMAGGDLLRLWKPAQFDAACAELAEREVSSTEEWPVFGTTQFTIEGMRIDFVFAHKNWRTGKVFRLAVECDGHDFHEKTKSQAAKDRSRDRAIQDLGWGIFRFTGSEIWKDPIDCARQVADWLSNKSCEKA